MRLYRRLKVVLVALFCLFLVYLGITSNYNLEESKDRQITHQVLQKVSKFHLVSDPIRNMVKLNELMKLLPANNDSMNHQLKGHLASLSMSNIELLTNELLRGKGSYKTWESFFKNIDYIFSYPDYCVNMNPLKTQNVFLLNIIISRDDNSIRRQLIRDTWGSCWPSNHEGRVIKTLFLFGNSLNTNASKIIFKESLDFGDIIQIDVDASDFIELKIQMALRWVNINCPTASYVLLAHDNDIVNMYRVVNYLTNKKSNTPFYANTDPNMGKQTTFRRRRFPMLWHHRRSVLRRRPNQDNLGKSRQSFRSVNILSTDLVHKLINIFNDNTSLLSILENRLIETTLARLGISPTFIPSEIFNPNENQEKQRHLSNAFIVYNTVEHMTNSIWEKVNNNTCKKQPQYVT
ncbi:uncharacterized protein [Antedon mediterranea]|uniref:uncharacterized protein n=1 Tax=Antedon mediterranea TaxID=105859 RepID=UPI003AF7B159